MVKSKRRKSHELLYYILLSLTIIFISCVLFLLSPLLLFGKLIHVHLVLFILGVSLGAFLKGFFHDLDELTHTHHAGLFSIILITALINFIALSASFMVFSDKTSILAFLGAFTFTISFLIPFAYHYYKNSR
ncbi:MAG: hypothetical protein ACLFN8_00795 [Candidatus Woesearchaeota archaeon]